MGEALVAGTVASGWCALADLVVIEPVKARCEALAAKFPTISVGAPSGYEGEAGSGTRGDAGSPGDAGTRGSIRASELEGLEGAVLAVKPQDAKGAAGWLSGSGVGRVLSIMAGVRISVLQQCFDESLSVIRAMPNTPALVKAGMSALSASSNASESDVAWAEHVLAAVGKVARVPETLLDAVTGLSGSGPAYIFMVVEAMTSAGICAGLPDELAKVLARETLIGSARLLEQSGEEPEALRAAVTSPGGTTAEGIRVLEERDLRGAFADAIRAASERSKELGGSAR